MKIVQFLIVAALTSLSIYACSSNAASDKSGKEYTSAYICPMHCTDSGSDEVGKCPVCKMAYVENPEQDTDATLKSPQDVDRHDAHEGHSH